MERSLLKEVTATNMKARLSTRFVKPMFFPNFFTPKRVSTLKWETLVGETGAPVVADVISWDSTAPQKKREVIGKLSGDIPKVAIKRGMNESDWNEYNQLRVGAQNDSDKLDLLNLCFKDQDFVYNGVRGRYEWMAMQMLSKGGVVLNPQNNAGIVTANFVGIGMPADNKKVSAVDWSNLAAADGLQDIADVVSAAAEAGRTIKYVVMHASDLTLLKKQKATIDTLKGWINGTRALTVTKNLINEYLAEQEIPVQIVTVAPAVRVEDQAGARTTVNPWVRKRITFLEDLNVGNIQYGPIAAENSAAVREKALLVKQDFILITKWSELEPFKEWTKAEANAYPVVNDPEGVFILKADGTAWNPNEDTEGTDHIPARFMGEDVQEESRTAEDEF